MTWFGRALIRFCWRVLSRAVAIAAVAVTIGALLVQYAPGSAVDDRALDAGLNRDTHDALQAENLHNSRAWVFIPRYASGILRGDFGTSRAFNRPVGELVAERAAVTAGAVLGGAAAATICGLAAALLAFGIRSRGPAAALATISASILAIPAAVVALIFLWTGMDARWAIAVVTFPHVFTYARGIIETHGNAPHREMAEARGMRPWRVLLLHVVFPALAELAAVAAMAVCIGVGAAIPIETICDIPGLGQLAWKAALSRDMPLLAGVTGLIALATVTANALAGGTPWREPAA